MISLSEIEKNYPANQRAFKKNILREYLQIKILQILFNSKFADKLSFMGGTCLRIVYNTNRFSEDLDFDNFKLNKKQFADLSQIIKRELELEGYIVEIKNVFKDAFQCNIKFPGLLYNNKLSGYVEEKILIQIDTEPQKYGYKPEVYLLNKFDVFTNIFITPGNLLLSQKLWAILNRKIPKGRDFYDVTFLFNITQPDFKYLKLKAGIKNLPELKEKLIYKCSLINFKDLISDVQAFLIKDSDRNRVLLFKDFIDSLN